MVRQSPDEFGRFSYPRVFQQSVVAALDTCEAHRSACTGTLPHYGLETVFLRRFCEDGFLRFKANSEIPRDTDPLIVDWPKEGWPSATHTASRRLSLSVRD